MNAKNFISEKTINSSELNESRLNNRLSLRKRNYNNIIYNKRMLISEIEELFPQDSENNLYNSNLLKTLSNQQILKVIIEMNGKLLYNENLTELIQCLFSLDYNMNQNLMNTIIFMNDNKIYIFLVDLLEQIININNMNNNAQLIFKILQILFKYSSNKENNIKLIEYINIKISIFDKILSLIDNKQIYLKKTDILLYSVIILYNLSIESPDLLNNIQKNKIQEKILSIINNKKNHLNISERNIYYIINFFSLTLLDQNVIKCDENYIQDIFNLLNEKGITSSIPRVQDISLYCLCNITSLFESKNFFKKIAHSNIFNNIYKYIKSSENMNSVIVSLKIVNNILTEKNIDLNYFIKSDLLFGLMQLIINYEKNKENISSDLLHHVISIFLYLVKSPFFYSLIDQNRKFMDNLIYLIGKVSNQVTHDILTFIKYVIDESYKISQLLILNNEELISNLIIIVRDEVHNDKIRIMALVILGKIIRYKHENMNEENDGNIKSNDYEYQLKDIIELNLLNNENINETLKKTFKIILSMINDE